MSEQQREQVRQFLLDKLQAASSGRSLRWLGWLFAGPEATYAFEHSGCAPDHCHCTGEVMAAWLIDHEGVRLVEILPRSVPDDRRGMWYRFRRFQFYISPARDWVVTGVLDGPRAGVGGRFRVLPRRSGFRLVAEGTHWRA